jgi:hypothetical protein
MTSAAMNKETAFTQKSHANEIGVTRNRSGIEIARCRICGIGKLKRGFAS